MTNLHDAIREAQSALERRWNDPAQADTELAERRALAATIGRRVPPFCQVSRAELVARVKAHDILTAVERWGWGSGSLVLAGPTRLGKTSAAAHLFRRMLAWGVQQGGEAWERAQGLCWVHAAELCEAVRGWPLGKGESPIVTSAASAPLTVVDDAGWERDAGSLALLFERRYRDGRPTVITTGLTRGELVGRYGDAVVRRIVEAAGKKGQLVEAFPAAESGAR